MKKIIYTFLIFNFHFLIVTAQSQFQFTIGGTNNDNANCIIQTTDGGYAIAGYTFSYAAGYEDMYIIKCTGSGTIQWTKTIGSSEVDIARSIIQTTDGGYAIAGDIYNNGTTSADWFIVKIDSGGTIQWVRTINRAAYDYACSIVQTADGGFAIAGVSATGGVFSGDMYIAKLNSAGTYQWSKTYGGSHDEVAYSIIQTADGGLAFVGYSNSFGPYNVFNIIKTDSSGNIQWNRLIGESGTGSHIYSIIQTSDGGLALAGEFTPTGTGNYDMYIVKLNSSGSIQWTRTVAGTGYDMANSIIQTTDGGYVLGGYTNSYGAGNYDMYIVKLNSSGALQWSKTVGGTGDEQAQSVVKSTDGGFVVAGYTGSFGTGGKDMFIVKFDSSGNTCGNTTSPFSSFSTSGTATSPTFSVVTQSPTVTTPTYVTGTGGILNTICSPLPPLAPNLVSPPNGSFNQPTSIRFIWNKPPFTASYRMQIALDSTFNSMVYNDSTLTDSTIVVANLLVNKYYWWRVNAKNQYGTSPYSSVWKFGTFPVGVKQTGVEIPDKSELYNNYPNPFNPSTKIRFDIAPDSRLRGNDNVTLIVFDVLGRVAAVLVNQQLKPGTYEVELDGSNYPSGIYFYKLETETFTQTKRMVLIK